MLRYKILFLLNIVLLSYTERVRWLSLGCQSRLVHVEWILRLRQIGYGFIEWLLGLKVSPVWLILSLVERYLTLEAANSTDDSILLEPIVLQTLLFFYAPFRWNFILFLNSFLLEFNEFGFHHVALVSALLILLL